MNLCDTGVLTRNTYFSAILRAFLGSFFQPGCSFLDYAGGYGVMTRMMRDAGLDYYWSDPYTQNVLARGFEDVAGLRTYSAVSAIEVFEHLPHPREEISKLFTLAPNLVVSTVLVPEPWPKPLDWWYYGLDHGQHVSFYTIPALQWLARAYDKIFVSNGRDLHGFLERHLLPLEIEANWLRHWLSFDGALHAAAVSRGYEFCPKPQTKLGWRKKMKRLVRKVDLPGVYVLKGSLEKTERDALVATTLTREYAGYLLAGGAIDVQRIDDRFPARTTSDMAKLARHMADQHGCATANSESLPS